MAPPVLLDEIVEEILLRIPPDDPARLVRAALVCMAWCRLVSGPRFRRSYSEFHRTAPMLGFFHNPARMARFVPTSSFRSPHADRLDWVVMDVRHGRVLLRRPVGGRADREHLDFEVWDPVTDERTALPRLKGPSNLEFVWSAGVFCASSKSGTCDHLDCRGGPTLVVFVVSTVFNLGKISVRVYSSEDGSWTWSEPAVHVVVHSLFSDSMMPSALVGNLVYFAFTSSKTILKYNLDTRETSDIHRPPQCSLDACVALMTTEDGRLQLATVDDFSLYLWSREDGHEGDAGWAQNRVIDLKKLIPDARALEISPFVVGAANGTPVVFLQTRDGLFTFDLKSEKATKVCTGDFSTGILPYTSFYTPVFDLSKNDGLSAGASSSA